MEKESHRFQLGSLTCTAVLDGTFAYPHPAKVLFANAPENDLKKVLSKHGLDPAGWEQYLSPYPTLLIESGGRRVLVDTGAGSFAPTTGRLLSRLQSVGIAPESIDRVVLTHAHPDHIGGTLDANGQPAFANARYLMLKREWEFWTADPDLSALKVDEPLKQAFLWFVAHKLLPLGDRMDLIQPGHEIVPGVLVVAAPGHTPGHLVLSVASQGEKLWYLADTFLHPIHVEQPRWMTAIDLLPEQSLKTRLKLLDRAADERALVLSFHFPFPGLGRVVGEKGGFRWHPI